MRAARCCALLVLLAAAVIAEPIVLRATRHVNAHAPARRARDGEPETYSENIVSDLETYAIEVNLGTPSKTYRVVVDTASADLFIYSNACPKTACPGPTLSTSASTSNVKCGAPLTCKSCGASDSACLFSQTYGDGATCSGRVVKEKINFGDKLVADAYVGLVDAATGGPGKPAFFTNASLSGIFGVLPTAATSNFGGQSPLFALMSDNKLPSGMTLCLRPDGGSLILGESFDHTRTNYQWSKLTSRSLYTVKLNDVAMPRKGFEGGLLSIADGAAILDSATTNIVLPAAHEAKFKAALKALCSKTRAMKGICDATPSIWTNFVQLTETDLAAFPNIVFYIDGLDSALALLPAMYMTSFNGYYTMNIDFYGTKTILGNGFMKNFRIGIDLVSRQIGFGNVMTCPGGAIPPMATDEETYRIVVNTSFTGFTFPNSKGLRYASMCGGVAPATHCDVGDVLCGKSGATKPRWDRECDDKSIFGRGFETEARFGKPMNRSAEFPAIIATRDIVMPASLPIDKPFVFATIKYFNPRLEAGSAPSQVTLRTTVDFTTPHGVDTYAAFSFDVTLNITHYGRCRGNGCPWNDPKSWPNKLHNAKCKDGALADGTPCCPYWSNRNVHNHCASLVQLGSVYDPNMRAAELDGQLYKIFFIGFHEDSKEHLNDRRLYEFFTADVNAVSQANLHARLIPMCPACPPGTKQTVFEDGSCTCQCETSCELPLVGEPDCSCIERISHDAVCNYFCDANDYANVPCVGGTLYVTDGHYMGLTLPPSPPCTWENYDPYRGYYGDDGGCRQYNDLYCQCVCGTSCPPGTFQNADCTCACSACPDNKMATDGCGCVCRESCHPAMVQDPNTCGCSCPAGCPAGQIQAADCSCYCPAGCPEGLVQRPDCSCGCPAACEAGKVQQGDCSCACPTACPAHKIEVAGCGCDCPAACANGQVQDPNTCACACAAGCPAGQIQQGDCSCTCPHQCGAGLTQAADCSCACATACPAGMVQNADNCQCSCATACPAGQVQDPTTCACGCAAACPGNKIADASCACRCATVCPAGQTQDPSTCLCACDNDCPAGQVQDAACGCACPSQCSAPHVQNADCSCSCPATDCGIKTLDPTTCHCSCSNVCVAPKLRLNTETCECQCPSACPAGQVQDPTTCGCSCPNVCPSGKVLVAETCACEDSCKLTCAAPKSLNYDECRCECAAGCPAGKVQDPATCACMCPQSCPTAKAQDAATCACSCPFTCAAGQTQNPDTCECSCADECPAGKARNADNCGCHCATACTGARSDQDPSTCECSCPSDCPAGQIQNLQTCECACPAACPAGQVRDSTGCGCHCAVKCPAGRIQDPTTCECGCAATCHAGQVQADNCQCSCPNFCREGRVQDQDCDCHCAVACSGAKSAQDPDSCECSCPNACPAGQTQNPDTCECSCPNACPTGQVRNANDCGCHCATSCIGAASAQDPDTCTCSCPNECPAGQAQHPLLCTCGCPNRCPAGQEHNADNCGCHCADACEEPKTVQDVTSCECMCPHVECPAGYVADDVHCGCKCAAECSEGHVLNAETCECECATACPPGLVQDKKSCECHCRERDCPAGQVQDPSTCACSCTEQCPAGQVRNTDDCGCHCANACTGAKSAQSADTCECSCPNVCNVPFVQDAASCACTCPNTCAAPLTLNAATCTCGCAEACPAGKVQSRDTCACECPNACPEDADLDDACVCVARRTASKKSNTAAIAGGVAGGVAALAVVAAAVAYLVRRNTAPGDHYRALSSDDQLAGSVTNPAFADSGLTVANPAFGVE